MRIPLPLAICFLLDVGLGLAYLGNYFVGAPSGMLTSFLDLDGEDSVSAWYSSTKFFCIFIMGLIYARANRDPENTSTYLLFGLPAIFLFFSIDESIQMHEWLGAKTDYLLPAGTREGTIFSSTGIWMFIFGIPLLVVFSWLVYSIRDHLAENRRGFNKVIVGMAILLLGALGIEIATNFVRSNTFGNILQVFVEEGLEMLGATVIFWGMYDMVVKYLPDIESPRSH